MALESWTENLCHQAVAAMESSVVSKPQSNMEPKTGDLEDEFIFLKSDFRFQVSFEGCR